MKMMASTIMATMLKGNGTVNIGINSSFGALIDKRENVDGHRNCAGFSNAEVMGLGFGFIRVKDWGFRVELEAQQCTNHVLGQSQQTVTSTGSVLSN